MSRSISGTIWPPLIFGFSLAAFVMIWLGTIAAGAKMLVYLDGLTRGTIGGGKFESLVIADAESCMREKKPQLKTFPLREDEPDSFGAICGGEATVLIEPQVLREAIFLVGAGHCAQTIARLAVDCGLFVSVLDDRAELLKEMPPQVTGISTVSAPEFIASRPCRAKMGWRK